MKKYTFEIEERLAKIVEITAVDEIEAMAVVRKRYFDEDIILDYNDFTDVTFSLH